MNNFSAFNLLPLSLINSRPKTPPRQAVVQINPSEFSKIIKVTNGILNIVNYTDLTKSAQFEDEKLPSKQNAEKIIILKNGFYNFTIRRMFNPDEETEETKTSFEIVTKRLNETEMDYVEKIFWWTF